MLRLNFSQLALKRSKPAVFSDISPSLMALVYPLGRHFVLPFYFGSIEVVGREHLPTEDCPLIFAPTHRSRWDALMVPYAAGFDITGRHLRFMVSADEMEGLQGWFIKRLGGFPIDTSKPGISSLRYGVELLKAGETLVIFPEGNIFREKQVRSLKPGLARLALQAASSQTNLDIKIVPINIAYSQPIPDRGCNVKINIGSPLSVANYRTGTNKQQSQKLTADLQSALQNLAVVSS